MKNMRISLKSSLRPNFGGPGRHIGAYLSTTKCQPWVVVEKFYSFYHFSLREITFAKRAWKGFLRSKTARPPKPSESLDARYVESGPVQVCGSGKFTSAQATGRTLYRSLRPQPSASWFRLQGNSPSGDRRGCRRRSNPIGGAPSRFASALASVVNAPVVISSPLSPRPAIAPRKSLTADAPTLPE